MAISGAAAAYVSDTGTSFRGGGVFVLSSPNSL